MTVSFLQIQHVKADVTYSRTFLTPTIDGCIENANPNYLVAHNSTTGYVLSTNYYIIGGQYFTEPSNLYYIYRTFLFFDTTAIPPSATINSAKLSIYIIQDESTTDFNVTIQEGSNPHPQNPLQPEDYYYLWYSGNGGSRNTSEIGSINAYWNITFNSVGLGYIKRNGLTKITLRSNRDISSIAPTTSEAVMFDAREAGESVAAKLYVTYTVSTGICHYIIHGPYYEDGSVPNIAVEATVYQPYNNSFTLTFNGTDGEDTFNFFTDQPLTYMSWPASATLNYTRIYYFLNTTFDEVWLFVCNPSTPSYPYQFTITDFYGMQNPYMETVINVNGNDRIVERKKLNVANTITFIMVQWTPYELRFRCTQGVYTQPFSAENTFTTNIPILSGSFPTTTYNYPTVTATRPSPSVITVAYVDPTLSTVWIRFQIYHYIGETGVLDYTLIEIGNSYSFSWTDADNATDYYIFSQAYATGQIWSWILPAPANPSGVNPWTGIIVPSLGTLPLINIDFSQVIAGAFILCVLGIFSYASAGVGCVLSWMTAGIFILMGWFVMSIPMFTFAGFVSILVMIDEAKRTEREI